MINKELIKALKDRFPEDVAEEMFDKYQANDRMDVCVVCNHPMLQDENGFISVDDIRSPDTYTVTYSLGKTLFLYLIKKESKSIPIVTKKIKTL